MSLLENVLRGKFCLKTPLGYKIKDWLEILFYRREMGAENT